LEAVKSADNIKLQREAVLKELWELQMAAKKTSCQV